jgi:hypothetical protein
MESILVKTATVSLRNYFSMLSYPIYKENNRISYGPDINQREMGSFSSLHRYAKNVYHIGYVLKQVALCHMTSSY